MAYGIVEYKSTERTVLVATNGTQSFSAMRDAAAWAEQHDGELSDFHLEHQPMKDSRREGSVRIGLSASELRLLRNIFRLGFPKLKADLVLGDEVNPLDLSALFKGVEVYLPGREKLVGLTAISVRSISIVRSRSVDGARVVIKSKGRTYTSLRAFSADVRNDLSRMEGATLVATNLGPAEDIYEVVMTPTWAHLMHKIIALGVTTTSSNILQISNVLREVGESGGHQEVPFSLSGKVAYDTTPAIVEAHYKDVYGNA